MSNARQEKQPQTSVTFDGEVITSGASNGEFVHDERLSAALERAAESSNPWAEAKRVLSIAPPSVRYVFGIGFFSAFGMTGSNTVLVQYFSDEFGYTDIEANTLRSLMVVAYVVISALTGVIVDRIGLRLSFVLGGVFGVIGSIFLSIAWNSAMLVMACVIFIPLSLAFVSPVMNIALRRYSYQATARVVFLTAYLVSNIGAALSLDFVDLVRDRFLKTGSGVLVYHEYQATAARIIFLVGAMSTLLASLMAAYGIKDLIVDERGDVHTFDRTRRAPSKVRCGLIACEPKFKALVVFSAIVAPAMNLFSMWDSLFPKAAVRELGEGAMFGVIKSINAWMIVVLLVPLSHYLRRIAIYKKLVAGTAMASLSMFILCAQASYATYISAIVIFTLFGEMVFSPHVNEFSTQYLPPGDEGVYSSVTGLYLVAPNFLSDTVNGWLLSTYCPREGERHCYIMWVIAALKGLTTTIGLIVAANYLKSRIDSKHSFEDGPSRRNEQELHTAVGTPKFGIVDEVDARAGRDDDDFPPPEKN